MAMVMRPTPAGTGVIAPATSPASGSVVKTKSSLTGLNPEPPSPIGLKRDMTSESFCRRYGHRRVRATGAKLQLRRLQREARNGALPLNRRVMRAAASAEIKNYDEATFARKSGTFERSRGDPCALSAGGSLSDDHLSRLVAPKGCG
jgi:hypothetical protein